jgi:hypothetical protein
VGGNTARRVCLWSGWGDSRSTYYWYHGKWKIEQQIKQGTCIHKLGYPLKIKHTAVQVPGQVPNLNKCKLLA